MKLLAQLLEADITAKLKQSVLELQEMLEDNEYLHDVEVTLEHDINDRKAEPVHEITMRVRHLGPGEFIDNAKILVTPTKINLVGEEGLIKAPLARADSHSPAMQAYYNLMPELICAKIYDALRADQEFMSELHKSKWGEKKEYGVMQVQAEEHKEHDRYLKLHISSYNGDAPRNLIFTWDPHQQGFTLEVGLIDMSLHGYSDDGSLEGAKTEDKAAHKVYKTADSVIDFVKERYDAK